MGISQKIDDFFCKLFGHDYEHGYIAYPWGIASYYPLKEPRCKNCRRWKSEIEKNENVDAPPKIYV